MVLGEFQFQDPQWLWCLALLPVIGIIGHASTAVHPSRARVVCTTLRCFGCAFLVVALAGPSQTISSKARSRTNVAILLDCSLSIGGNEAASERAEKYAADLSSLGPVHQIEFAAQAWGRGEPQAAPDGTNIEAAFMRAQADLGSDNGVVVLLSDGRSTTGDAVQAATRLRAQGHTVHVLPAGNQRRAGPHIVGVAPPTSPRKGQAAVFLVHVRSDVEDEYELRLLDGKGIEVERLEGPVARDAVVALKCVPGETGFQNYRVVIVGKSVHDSRGVQTIAAAPIFVQGPPKVLIIDTSPDESGPLSEALRDSGLQVETASLDNISRAYDDLVQYDAVLLNDCPAVGDALQSDLVRYVEESGGGLVFIGGQNVRTSAWYGSRLEGALPVEFLPERVRAARKKQAVHVCFVLDKSGSMGAPLGGTTLGQVSKLDMVKAAVQQSVAELPADALVSVVVFDGVTTVLADRTPAAQWGNVASLVDQLKADGGTMMDLAFESGLDLLSNGERRYMILLTDGQTLVSGGDPKRRWDELVERLRALDISLTTVALGSEADRDLLAYIASNAAGISYECTDASEVPTIFIQEAKSIKETTRAESLPFTPLAGEFAMTLRGMPAESFPRLKDAISTRCKAFSQAVLLTDKNEPLLALHRQGLGTVIAFTSDAKSAWARDWVAWRSFGRFWTQVVSWALRPINRVQADVKAEFNGTDLRILIGAKDEDGSPAEHLEGTGGATITNGQTGQGSQVLLNWREIRPGVYESNASLATAASYLCTIQLSDGRSTVFTHSLVVSASPSAEMAETGSDPFALHAIAEAGGGLFGPTPDQIIQSAQKRVPRASRGGGIYEWWHVLVLILIFIWLADVTTRRVLAVISPSRT